MTKEQEIAHYLTLPIKKGDEIIVKGVSTRDADRESLEDVEDVDSERVYFFAEGHGNKLQSRLISEVKKSVRHIGANSFAPEVRNTSYQIDIEQLVWRCGYDRTGKSRMEQYFGVDIPELCVNPIVFGKDGEEIEYQRGLVWTPKQKELLIDSIYNRVDIGKFVFRKRDFKWVQKRIDAGKLEHTAFMDLVDGKQRYTAIIEFITNKFKDSYGNYFSDLSKDAQRTFMSYRNLAYVELPEETTDSDVLKTFLAINHTGVPMSEKHIEFVKSINVK